MGQIPKLITMWNVWYELSSHEVRVIVDKEPQKDSKG